MLIDWFTVVAQIINFLVLAFLLKIFLYRPILEAIDAREQRISSELKEASIAQHKAEEERALLLKKSQEVEKYKKKALADVEESVLAEKERALSDMKKEVDRSREEWKETLQKEKEASLEELQLAVQNGVFSIVRKAFQDLAGAKVEEQAIDFFLTREPSFFRNHKELFSKGIGIKTAHLLSDVYCDKIRAIVRLQCGDDVGVDFEMDPAVIAGIEIVASGQKAVWSFAEYLSSLQEKVSHG